MPTVVRLTSVDLVIGGKHLLRGIDWTVDQGDHWVVLGPNGAGKTTLLRLVAGYAHPTRGRVEVLDGTLGRTDVRRLRTHVGYLSPHLGDMFAPQISALDAVTGARSASIYAARHHHPAPEDVVRAEALLERLGCGALVDRELGTLSAGERKRVLIARSLLVDPAILVLDEPGAALDLGGRELLVETLSELAREPGGPVLILVSHHVEEIPPGFDRALLLTGGQVVGAGAVGDVVDSGPLSAAFGLPLQVTRSKGRFTARSATHST